LRFVGEPPTSVSATLKHKTPALVHQGPRPRPHPWARLDRPHPPLRHRQPRPQLDV